MAVNDISIVTQNFGNMNLCPGVDFNLEPEMLLMAIQELHENPDTRSQDLLDFQSMVRASDVCQAFSDDLPFLLRYLRIRKYDKQRALKCLTKYISYHFKHADIFAHLAPSKYEKVFNDGICLLLPRPDRFHRRIYILRPEHWNPNDYSIHAVLAASLISMERAVLEPNVQVAGVVVIYDLSTVKWSQARHFTPKEAKRFATILSEAMPVRVKGLHMYKAPKIVQGLVNVARVVVKAKLQQRIMAHSSLNSLHKVVQKECLPIEYGGDLASCETLIVDWSREIASHEDHFRAIADRCQAAEAFVSGSK